MLWVSSGRAEIAGSRSSPIYREARFRWAQPQGGHCGSTVLSPSMAWLSRGRFDGRFTKYRDSRSSGVNRLVSRKPFIGFAKPLKIYDVYGTIRDPTRTLRAERGRGH